MRRLRTVTVTVTPLMADIISQLVAERAPIDIVASLDDRDQLASRLRTLLPELVLIGLDQSEGGAVAISLHDAVPRARVIALSHDARHAYLSAPPSADATAIDLSPQALIEAVRGF
jgi:DNA-binding NarL/FixJ family response regulator